LRFGFTVLGLGFWVSRFSFGFRVSGFGVRGLGLVSGFGFSVRVLVLGSGFRVQGFGVRGFGIGFGFRLPAPGFRVLGFKV
jgi:hypothetical protein